MIRLLINKELKAIIQSPKFAGTFVVCSVLILLSIYTGVREYQVMSDRYDAASMLVDQEMRQQTSWGRMFTAVYRKPDPMQIFSAGVDYDIGRRSAVSSRSGVKLENSAYSDDPLYALFRMVDFSFITRFILRVSHHLDIFMWKRIFRKHADLRHQLFFLQQVLFGYEDFFSRYISK